MLPTLRKKESIQIYQPDDYELFNEYFFKVNNEKSSIGIRYLFYDHDNHKLLISNVNNGKVYILNLKTGKLDVLDHHNYTVRKVIICGDEIFTASWDNTVRVFDKNNLQPRLILTTPEMGRCPTFEISSDQKWIYTFTYDSDKNVKARNTIRKWSLKTGKLLKVYEETGDHYASTRSGGLFLYKKNVLGVASDSGFLNFFNIRSGKLVKSNYKPKTVFRSTEQLGDYVFMAELSGKLHKYSMTDGCFDNGINYAHKSDITNVKSFKKAGKYYLFTCGFDGATKIWSYPDLKLVNEILTPYGKWALTFIGENTLITGDLVGNLMVYDINDLKSIKFKGVVRLFLSGSYIANIDDEHKDKVINNRFYTNDHSMVDIYKGKPNKKDLEYLPWHLRPIGEVANKPDKPKNKKIEGKQAEHIVHACNNIEVLHLLFQDINGEVNNNIPRLSVTPLLQGVGEK